MAAHTISAVPNVVNKTVSRIAAAEGFKTPSYRVVSGSNAEDGYTSLLYRVTIQEEDQSSLLSGAGRTDDLVLMVKVPDQNSDGNSFTKLIFASESAMYKSVLPAMQEIAHMLGTLPWPRCFHASADGPDTSLVFEDLRLEGFVMADRRVAMDAEHCRLALSQLAKFHGAGMALQHFKPKLFKDLTKSLENPFSHPEMQALFAKMSDAIFQAIALVTEKYPEGTVVNAKLLQKLQSYGSEWQLMSTAPQEGPGVAIAHGDSHVNNVMFRYNQTTGAVEGCRLIDFQMSRVGPTAVDVATLLLPCTEKSMRDKHWAELLRGYHAELQNTLKSSGCDDPDAVYSWDQFMECLRKYAMSGFVTAPILLHAQFADKEAADELREALNGMGKAEQPVSFNIRGTDQIKQRLTGIVESLAEWDWL